MKREDLYLSTIAPDAGKIARRFGLGVEIAEYCTAWNMDEKFRETDAIVRKSIAGVSNVVLHAPFNELFPCAIDKKIRALAGERYRQAIALAQSYGAQKVVIHGGYNPWLYYHPWYIEQSISFWQDFLREDPGVELVLENVLEETPELLREIVASVHHPKLKLCLDVGHVNAYSKVPVEAWLTAWGPYISHFHIHNNYGDRDSHNPIQDGTIVMTDFLKKAEEICHHPTFTLELMETEPSVLYLLENSNLI